jgi:hypothetical protein
LTRKLAEILDGVDLTRYSVGEVLDLPVSQARLLLAEGWAVLVTDGLVVTNKVISKTDLVEL